MSGPAELWASTGARRKLLDVAYGRLLFIPPQADVIRTEVRTRRQEVLAGVQPFRSRDGDDDDRCAEAASTLAPWPAASIPNEPFKKFRRCVFEVIDCASVVMCLACLQLTSIDLLGI